MVQLANYHKILLAVDGSENAHRAAEAIDRLYADKDDMSVTVVFVVEPYYNVGWAGNAALDLQPAIEENREEQGREVIARTTEFLRSKGITCDSHLLMGRAGKEICRTATEGAYDIIVMGRQGRGRLEEMLLGSVSTYVLHHCHLPVLVIQ